MLPKILESEIHCGFCKQFFTNPRLLDCGHSACSNCIKTNINRIVSSASASNPHQKTPYGKLNSFQKPKYSNSGSHESSEQDALSESDSGIFLSNNVHEINTIKPNTRNYHVGCSLCSYISIIPQHFGINSQIDYFQSNNALQALCQRYQHQLDPMSNPADLLSSSSATTPCSENSKFECQLCEDNTHPNQAGIFCEQCNVFYCDSCREKFHPMRGPLEKHALKPITDTFQVATPKKSANSHEEYIEVKKAKVTLSKSLQRLSEKAKLGSEFIQGLKLNFDDVKKKHQEFVEKIDSQLDELIDQMERKRAELHRVATIELEKKETLIKQQINEAGHIVTKTTGMINMAAELIKESDPMDFGQISEKIINRSLHVEKNIVHELNDFKPKFRNRFEYKLETGCILHELNKLEFKDFLCPDNPKFILDRCSVWDNLINVVWHPQGSIDVDRYLLEIDDGNGGNFKTAYCGPESMCTIENLHFSANYRLRVKSINEAGISASGDLIKLTTSAVAKFRLLGAHPTCRRSGVSINKDGTEVESSGSNAEEVVFMASTGFSKGVHYWEFLIDYYDGVGEPSFGVAMENCAKNKKLGTDMLSWGMYMNAKRSWFLHQSEHSGRADASLAAGHRLGVCLDLDRLRLSFYLDGRPHGPGPFSLQLMGASRSFSQIGGGGGSSSSSAASSCAGSSQSLNDGGCGGSGSSGTGNTRKSAMLYPAVSVSHGIKLRLVTGVMPPSLDSQQQQRDASLEEMTTPSLTRRLDMTGLMLDGLSHL